MDLNRAIHDLVLANRIVAHLGVVDSFGHISVRHPTNPERYLLSRSRAPRLVCKDDIMEFHLDNAAVDARGRQQYGERFIHGCIYSARPDVMSVCHNHAHELLPLAVTKSVMRPAIHTAAVIGREVPVWDIRDEFGDTNMLVTTNDMGRSLARTLGKGHAALMRGHGSVVAGISLQDAVFTANQLQLNAEVLVKARAINGEITYLSDGETDLTGSFHHQGPAPERAWEHWVLEAGLSDTARGSVLTD